MRYLNTILICALLFFLAACGNDTPHSTHSERTINDCSSLVDKNQYIYDTLKTHYLWHDTLPSIDPKSYESEQALLAALIYQPKDKWSYITTAKTHDEYYEEGRTLGYGFRLQYNQDNQLKVSYVWPDSPAADKGLQRGYTLTAIDGQPLSAIEDVSAYLSTENDKSPVFSFTDNHEQSFEETLTPAWYKINTLNHTQIYTLEDRKIGYFSLSSFISTSQDELDTAFKQFNDQQVKHLIIDLRYNGGGLLSITNYLASLLNPNKAGQTFVKLKYNNQNSNADAEYQFKANSQAIEFESIHIITTQHTASASEALINGLKPYVNITLMGTTTYGKPVGSSPRAYCDNILSAITFEVLNAADSGDYFSGISADCYAEDDLSITLGDTSEPMLAATLAHLTQGTCAAQPSDEVAKQKPQTTLHYRGDQLMTGAF